MKKKEFEKTVLKSMSIGLASMMAIMSVPMNALAEELEEVASPVITQDETSTDSSQAVKDLSESTNEAADQIDTLTSTISETTSNTETTIDDNVEQANNDLIAEVAPKSDSTEISDATDVSSSSTTDSSNTESEANSASTIESAKDFETSVSKVVEDYKNIENTDKTIDEEYQTAKEEATTAYNKASELDGKLDNAISAIEDQKKIIMSEGTDIATATAACAKIESIKAQARKDYSDAEAAYKAALKEYEEAAENAKKDLKSYSDLLDTYEKDLTQAKTDLDDAKEKVDELNGAIDEIKTAYDEKVALDTHHDLSEENSDLSALKTSYSKMKNYSAAKDAYQTAANQYGATNINDAITNFNTLSNPSWNNMDNLFKTIVEGYYVSNVLAPGATNVHVVDANTISDGDNPYGNSSVFVRFANAATNYAMVTYEIDGETKTIYLNYKSTDNQKKPESMVIFEKTTNDDGTRTNALYDAYEKSKNKDTAEGLLFVTSDNALNTWLKENAKSSSKKAELENKVNETYKTLNTSLSEMNSAITKANTRANLNVSYDSTLSTEALKKMRDDYINEYNIINERYIEATEAVIPIWVKYTNEANGTNIDASEIIKYFDTYQRTDDENVYRTNKDKYIAFYSAESTKRRTKILPIIKDTANYYESNKDAYTSAKESAGTAAEKLENASSIISSLKSTVEDLKQEAADTDSLLGKLADTVKNAKELMESALKKKNSIDSVATVNTYIRKDNVEQDEDGLKGYNSSDYTGNQGSLLLNTTSSYRVFVTRDAEGNETVTSYYDRTKTYSSQEEAMADYISKDNNVALSDIASKYLASDDAQNYISTNAPIKIQELVNDKQSDFINQLREAGVSEADIEAGTWVLRDSDGNEITMDELQSMYADSAYVHWYVLKQLSNQAQHIDGLLAFKGIDFSVELQLPKKATPIPEIIPEVTPEVTPEATPTDDTPAADEPVVTEAVPTAVAAAPVQTEVLGANREVEEAAPQSGVLGARRNNTGAVLGARRDAATGDMANAGFFASLLGAGSFLGAAYELIRRRKKDDAE